MGCGKCHKDKPDKAHLCDVPCGDCTPNCEPEHCDCPVHLNGQCVHYNGCVTFITQLRAGMNLDECLKNIENVFEQVDGILESYKTRILELENDLKELSNKVNGTESCETGYIGD